MIAASRSLSDCEFADEKERTAGLANLHARFYIRARYLDFGAIHGHVLGEIFVAWINFTVQIST
jgi:hypothetical protein